MTARATRFAVLVAVALVAVPAAAVAPPPAAGCAGCVRAGAAAVPLRVPAGTPLAGYGVRGRRLLLPDILGRFPHAFWFKPAAGELDPLLVRTLVVDGTPGRVVWVTLDVIAVDRSLTDEAATRVEAAGLAPGTLILSASHTHSGPGAFVDSALMAPVAVDRYDRAVREALLGAVTEAVRRADARRVPARIGAASTPAPPLTRSRLGRPLDHEIVLLKVVGAEGRPIALLWNYAIHGTMLGPRNLRFSGDVMGAASRALERELGVPALYVNGAVGDVSPERHGEAAARDDGVALARAVAAAWAAAETRPETRLATASITVELPVPAVSLRSCLGRWLPRSLRLPLGWALPREATLTAVALGETVGLTIPGELQTSLGQAIKQAGRRAWRYPFVAGLSNGYLGYFLAPPDVERVTYVACANLYGAEAGARLTGAAEALLGSLAGGQGRPR